MDMTLDDIISQTKGSRQGRGGGQGRRGSSVKTVGGFNNRGGGGGGGGRRFNGGGSRGFTRVSRGGGAERIWSHDQYEGGRRGPVARNGPNVGGGPAAKITVSNLHFGVSDDDIAELFSEMGNIRYASVHYDRTGRSLGKADVVFERRGDAQKAIAQYHGVPLDGRDMSIDWASTGAPSAGGGTPRKNYASPLRQTQDGRISRNPRGGPGTVLGGRGGGGIGRGRGRGGFRRNSSGPTVTAAELDAELDMYISQKQ